MEDVDEELEVNVQIGPSNLPKEGPDLTLRYNSVMINGFLPGTDLKEVHDILLSHGLPPEKLVTDISRRENSGKLTIDNLGPDICLLLMDRLHGKIGKD